jgi:tetratricopeptide (TPR) repeat protein
LLSPRTIAAENSPKEQALELFEQSSERYRAGKFDEAAALLEKAYALHNEPVLLYNLGRAYDGLGEYEKAIDAYEKYLAESPETRDRGAVERRIATMRSEVAQRAELERERKRLEAERRMPATPDEKPKAAEPSAGPSPWPWVVAGVGVAAMGAGAVFGLQANGKRSDAEDEPVQRKAAETFRDAESLASTANVFLIAGAVVTAGGVTWIFLDNRSAREKIQLSLRLTPRSVSIFGRL